MAHLSQPQSSFRLSRPLTLALAAAAGLSVCGTAAAQTPQSGDNLNWIGGTTNSSWTSPNLVWNDVGGVSAGPGPISLSSSANQALTYGFFFLGNNASAGTVAPNVMSIDQSLNANFISFLDGFAANNSMTIGRSVNDGLAKPLNLVNGWQIADRGVGGTVNFAQYATNNAPGQFGGLYFNLNGAGGITAVTGANVVLNVNVAGSGSLSVDKPPTDNGAGGTVTLVVNNSNGNSYSGGTTVQAGTLVIAGGSSTVSATGTGAITVNSGGTLAGNGVGISNTTVNSGGLLAPGATVGTVGRLTLGGGGLNSGLTINGTLGVDIVGGGTTAGTNNDQVAVSGNLTLNATSSHLVLSSVNPAGLKVNDKFFIVLDSGTLPVAGTFNGLLQGATVTDPAGDPYTINYLDNGDGGTLGNDVSLTVTNVVPEPSPALLALVGLAGLVGLRRWRSGTPRLLAS